MDIPSQLTHWLTALFDGGSIVGVVVGVAKAFEWFDGMVSDTGRQALSNQLRNAPSDERIDSWATVFPKLIDCIFGERALSLKFVFRSAIASLIAVLIVFLFWWRLIPSRFHVGLRGVFWFVLQMSFVTNIIPDYRSLLISRTIVRAMVKRPTPLAVGILLVIDSTLSVVVGFISGVLALIAFLVVIYSRFGESRVIMALRDVPWDQVLLFKWMFSQVHVFVLNVDMMRLFVLSSLFTSIWVWLYVGSIVTIRILHKVRAIWVRMAPYLDIDKKPLVAIGRISGLLAGAGYTVILGFVWIGRHWH